jgi:hypothetical protein|tara:strand:+ start:512 stop:1087 length:576 start_codon:yes stop_codon:yes gene_type:complete
MGLWEDLEVLEGSSYNEKYKIFLDFFTSSRDKSIEEEVLINDLNRLTDNNLKEEILKKLFVFKKKNTTSFIHCQFIPENDFDLSVKEVKKIVSFLRKEYERSRKFKLFSFYEKDQNLISLIKVQNKEKEELIEKITTNQKTKLTRSIIIERKGNLEENKKIQKRGMLIKRIQLIVNFFRIHMPKKYGSLIP